MHTAADTQALPNWTVQLLEAGLQQCKEGISLIEQRIDLGSR